MKLEILKPEAKVRKGQPSVSILKNGCVIFNKTATEKLPFLQKDARIAFCEDKDKHGEWYITPSVSGFIINRYKKNGMGYHYLQFQSSKLRYAMMESLEISDKKPIPFKIAIEPIEFNGNMYHALILVK